MATKRDYYDVLGVTKNSDSQEIKSAYRKLAKQYHPDINKSPDAEEKFKEVQEAYDVLSDPQKKALYDQFGHAAFDQTAGSGPFGGGPGGFQDVDLGDIFSSFFGGAGGRAHAPTGPLKGNDVIARIRIDFMDAINGKRIKFPHTYDQMCSHCNGTGADSPSDIHTCGMCHGSGYVNSTKQTIFGTMQTQTACPTCGGTGQTISKQCGKCGGNGYNRVKVDLDVKIPEGINSGQQIRISGKGERGYNGGPNGDLYLEVLVKPHPNFVRNGNDITLKVPIDFVDAALGVTIEVPTVYGNVDVKVPAGTQPSTKLRLKGRGVKGLKGSVGDQYLEFDIQTPTNLTKEQKELLEQYKNIEPKNRKVFKKFKDKFKK
ncbi:MAG: molecular chaperone DnaJ [Bacilli bacterium]|jgi:molecular chaperone DnaJ